MRPATPPLGAWDQGHIVPLSGMRKPPRQPRPIRHRGLDSTRRHRLPPPARRCAAATHAHALITRGLILGACALLLNACALPSLQGRPQTLHLRDTVDTRLARATASEIAAHPSRSGVYPLRLGPDAFVARVLLAKSAVRSIDAQYYIWKLDHTGTLLLAALWDAANRGVRVRLLLDDQGSAGLDPTLATLAAHKNIEVRLFNPLVHRRARWANYLFDFGRVNHRMHNKSFTVDNQVTIVGGRNVGDEYFGAGSGSIYDDFDIMGVGPMVNEVSGEFDLYWNSASAYPVQKLVSAKPVPEEQLTASFSAMRANPDSQRYLDVVRKARLVSDLESKRLMLSWVDVRVMSDLPSKVYDTKDSEDMLLLSQLIKTLTSTTDPTDPIQRPLPGVTTSAYDSIGGCLP